MIIRQAGSYNSAFYSSLPSPVNDGSKYLKSIKPIFSLLDSHFPFLKMVCLPTKQITTAYIQGLLLPSYTIKEMGLLPEQYNYFGLPIFANIPEDFQEKGIDVYDARNRITWEKAPKKFQHYKLPSSELEKQYNMKKICTHRLDDINSENCVKSILLSAYYLFQEYCKFDATGKFDLDCHPHGNSKY